MLRRVKLMEEEKCDRQRRKDRNGDENPEWEDVSLRMFRRDNHGGRENVRDFSPADVGMVVCSRPEDLAGACKNDRGWRGHGN